MKTFVTCTAATIILWCVFFSCKSTQKGLQPRLNTEINDGYSQSTSDQRNTASSSIENTEKNFGLDYYLKRTSGVFLNGEGRNAKVFIRGVGSFGSTEPLFIINGMPAQGGYSQVYEMITPQEIKRITVLKDDGATSIYGSRGSNGVVLITTKTAKDQVGAKR